MTLTEKFAVLTPEQAQELGALTTAEEVLDFAKKAGVDLTPEEAAEIASRLPDDALEAAAGGSTVLQDITPMPAVPVVRWS